MSASTSASASASASPSPSAAEKYELLTQKLKALDSLKSISGLLEWDQHVMMPTGSGPARGEMKAALEGAVHEKGTASSLGDAIAAVESFGSDVLEKELDEWQRANVRDARRNFDKLVKIPQELAERAASLGAESAPLWAEARAKSDWSLFAPKVTEWIELRKKIANHIDPSALPYDVCMDDYERGLSSAFITKKFDELRPQLIDLVAKVKASTHKPNTDFIKKGSFDLEKQRVFCESVAKDIGFDTKFGRLDKSVHPFTGGSGPTDVRMTTRYKEENFTESLTGLIHETGHSLYEQGRNAEQSGLPVSVAMSMGVHESQSLLWERMVGLSEPFVSYYWPAIQKEFGITESAAEGYKAFNEVSPGFIRTESDELTYPLHIMIRYEIEMALFSGELAVEDVPRVWNEKMKEYLGVEVTSDAVGCLQDIHWAVGYFGYFPTYLLGAQIACQIYEAASKANPELSAQIGKGEFAPLKSWLNENVHKFGSLQGSAEKLLIEVTGRGLDVEVYLKHLRQKYADLYKVEL